MTGCSGSGPPPGFVGHVRAYFGGAAADEPEAVLVARDVLSAGGGAVDAVVAMGLTMMVTRPDAAGPGGGGMCIAFDAHAVKGDAIDFLPRAPQSPAGDGRWQAVVPGSFRGLFAFHARYGNLPWEQLVIPAEQKARFGVRIPRVLTRVLAKYGRSAIKDDRGRSIFFNAAGAPLVEGDALRQVDLAATLSRLRVAGPGDFYSGSLANKFVEGVRRAGGRLTIEDMRGYRPKWTKAVTGTFGPHDIYFLPSPAAGGDIAARIWRSLGDRSFFAAATGKTESVEATAKFAEAARRGYQAALVQPRIGADTASAGAVAIDRLGNSAACVFTMNRPFGSGHVAGDTGIMPVEPMGAGALMGLSAMIVANRNTKQTFLAATGAGDQFSSSAMTEVVRRVVDGKQGVERALSGARVAATGRGDIVVEADTTPAARAALSATGGKVTEVPRIGLVNVMSCPGGVVTEPRSCVVRTDPRGFGHAINAGY